MNNMRRSAHNTTKLPRQLLDQLGEQDSTFGGAHSGRAKPQNGPGHRKESRKVERQQKKVQRQHSRRPDVSSRGAQAPNADEDEELKPVPSLVPKPEVKSREGKQALLKSILKRSIQQGQLKKVHTDARSPSPPPRLSRGVRDKLAEDDAEIAALEKRLGMKGKKKLPKSFVEDGLDSLVDNLSEDVLATNGKRKRSEGDDWLKRKRKQAEGVAEDASNNADDDGEEDESEGADSGRYSLGSSGADSDIVGEGFDAITSAPSSLENKVRENPYIAPPVLEAAYATAKYIPPSLRASSLSEAQSLAQLRRQMQGLLNRLSDANLVTILGDVEKLYRAHPRQHVTSTLIDLLLGLLCDRSKLMDTFLILHAGFIAAVYKIIGTDFGAQLLQKIVEDFEKFYAESSDREAGKETSNLMSLLAELYNFQVVGSTLMFDYIRAFLADISEVNTELLLKIIRISGTQLRQDDPSALKDIVMMLQPAIATIGEANLSIRTKFMIETINSLKNNRMKTGATASAVTSEHTIRMKKIIGSLNNRTVRASEPLRVGLKDIKDTEQKGKWWLIGASWKSGHAEDGMGNDHDALSTGKQEIEAQHIDHGAGDLLRLAREQRMNTDIRRAIFITIMSASDYRDAHLRLLKLKLKRSQELEVPRVLMHCAGAEQLYNPYYTLIARRLCSEHRMKMAFQFSLWDLFRRMGEGIDSEEHDDREDIDEHEGTELGTRTIVNLAKLYGSLIAEAGLKLGVLKTLNLAYLQPRTKTFIELLLITVITHSQRQSGTKRDEKPLLDIVMKVKDSPQMARGLQYFLKKVVSKTDVTNGDEDKATVRWGCRIAVDALTVIASAKAQTLS
ncbi:MAG: suppressor of glycerol defect [Candelina mexicana]|nr:MAG: suppressor of glycerol defect [Candelina mexicana]